MGGEVIEELRFELRQLRLAPIGRDEALSGLIADALTYIRQVLPT